MPAVSIRLVIAAAFAVPACSHDIPLPRDDAAAGSDSGSADPWEQLLASRTIDLHAALRIAALRLTGELPTLTEIDQVARAPADSKRAAYQAIVREYLERPSFARQMFYFWRDTFKMGGTALLDTAPAFAAQLSARNGNYTELFTRASNNCPSFDDRTGVFTSAECSNGGPRAGVLTNPGMNAHFASHLAFRRVRWVQEIFDCVRFPVEMTGESIEVGGALPYQGAWPFTSIAGPKTGGRIDFQDVSSSICAHCHQTLNHIAPLFAYYDAAGAYQTTMAVTLPLDGAPVATMADFLPETESPAWRYGTPAPDLPARGAALAADRSVAKCAVARLWNFAFGHPDIVDALRDVPIETVREPLDAFIQNGFKLKDLVFAIFDSEDFIRF